MSSENELKEGNIQQPEENEGSGEIEGYSYCNSHKARCLNDCGGNGQATPFLSDLKHCRVYRGKRLWKVVPC